ncbi:MAG: adenylosuccinate synthase [Saprospiraceae bacterium]|nr:adenylosuccinate synthase [Saprospiraceae bacterium]MCB0623150.1 adenylosuccinate synthase [Saprospiraceae bacterium]MCB0678958.1 adenylosuccinate synthase [Saprospiraceae bacterium]MCB0680483.1 adenylosuccinate synthase [Saprospiraceae bacterium]
MNIDVILGLQWGDEGKGKIVDYLAEQYDLVARFQGGPNAGHTLKFDGQKFVLHTVPSGIFRDGLINLIGNGVVVDPITLKKELDQLEALGINYSQRLFIAKKAHLILPTHRYLDAAAEAAKGVEKIGSTLKGIGPTYMDKTGRNGIRVGDILLPNFEEKYRSLCSKHLGLLKMYPPIDFHLQEEEEKWFASLDTLRRLPQVNSEYYINQALDQGKRVLAEGAQGSMLDIDFGTYPFVTSSNTVTAGVCNGLGVAPGRIGEVIGITKAYTTRVGSGPFPTELHDATGERLRAEGGEFGATTGRPRRCGWLDLPQLHYTIMLNGVTQLVVTKIDVLNHFEEIQVATKYRYDGQQTDQLPYDLCEVSVEPVFERHAGWMQSLDGITEFQELPEACSAYLKAMEQQLQTPVTMVSTGPERQKLLVKDVEAAV